MERQKPNEILIAGEGFTVYCKTEDKILYASEGKDFMVERLVAKDLADGHARDLRHEVYIITTSKKNTVLLSLLFCPLSNIQTGS